MKPGQWGWTFDELLTAWTAAEEAGVDLLSCFDGAGAETLIFVLDEARDDDTIARLADLAQTN